MTAKDLNRPLEIFLLSKKAVTCFLPRSKMLTRNWMKKMSSEIEKNTRIKWTYNSDLKRCQNCPANSEK